MAYLEGQIQGGINAVGGETTGYQLTVDVDLSAIENADQLDGQTVGVSGEVVLVNYTESGPKLVFKAVEATAKQ